MSIKIINTETIINEILIETEIYTITIDRFAEITQFNTANHAFFNNYINNLLHYAQFYVNQFSKELAVKTLIKNNAEHAKNFKKKNNYFLNWFIINSQKSWKFFKSTFKKS